MYLTHPIASHFFMCRHKFRILPMNQTPTTTPPSRQRTQRAANTRKSFWVDTLPDAE